MAKVKVILGCRYGKNVSGDEVSVDDTIVDTLVAKGGKVVEAKKDTKKAEK